jgi:hypothetical protein
MGMPWSTARSAFLLGACVALTLSPRTSAARVDAATEAQRLVSELERSLQKGPAAAARSAPDARSLLARGKAELAAGRYGDALTALHQALELETTATPPGGLGPELEFLLGSAYLEAGQPYSAYRHFLALANRSGEPGYGVYAARGVARLVDAAFATENPALLPELRDLLDRLLGIERTDELSYARAKLAFALGRYREAKELASSISNSGITYKRSLYLKGAALAKEAGGRKNGLREAIAEFERAVQVPAPEEPAVSRQISDLSRLAVARLHYESGSFDEAVANYTRIDRDSPLFSEALFELAWAYVKQGDFTRAEQTLAALSVLDPGLIDGADAALLRSDMLLRSGHFEDAERLYSATYQKYEPLRRDLDDFLARHASGADYYARLLRSELDAGQELPKALLDLVREEARGNRLFAAIDEVTRSRKLYADGRRIATLLRATVSGPARAKLFPELGPRLEALVVQENQLARAHLALVRGLDRVSGAASGELSSVRAARRQLMDRVATLATARGELVARVARDELGWIGLGQALKRLEVEADQTQALCNGLRRVLTDADAGRISISEEAKRRHREDLTRGEQDLVRFRRTIEGLRLKLEIGRLRTGLGSEWTAQERKLGDRFGKLVRQEFRLVAAGADRSSKAQRYATDSSKLLARMNDLDTAHAARRQAFDQELSAASADLASRVAAELSGLSESSAALDELERAHADVLGAAAKRSFVAVRDRLTRVVRHAELGMAQKSFEVREERRRRVERLKRQRARETKLIQDELAEVMGESEAGP